MLTGSGGLGFNPLKAVKKGVTSAAKSTAHVTTAVARTTARGVATGAKATGHGVTVAAKTTAHVAVGAAKIALIPLKTLEKYVLGPVLALALRPVKSKVQQLVSRRARKLAMDRRKSTTPNAAETAEAKVWAKNKLNHEKPPFGRILAMLV